ncbi:orc1/cdc6 family replication initiation protein [Candidatus Woesearchaeota archaeon]|nr:orc1/cdc6 family replication initiation protein [Candidatus Woesearchaeota archaeon]
MAWYNNFDFDEDPFLSEGKLFAANDVLDEMKYRVESGSMVFLEGKEGFGKTAVLKCLIDVFGGKGKIIYFDCGRIEKKVNIEDLMKGRYGFFGRMFGVKPKNMMLFLDNANFLSKKNCERIKYYFDNNFIKSVVFTGISYSRAHFSKSVRDRIGGRVIRLKGLSEDQAIGLVRERVPNTDIISDDMAKVIFRHSGGNVRKFLADLSAASEKAVSDGAEKVSEKHISEILGDQHVAN